MSKRKELSKSKAMPADDLDGDSSSDEVDVDFEFFDPQPDVDFHGLKALLRQLFDIDNTRFDISALADLILSQPLLGSTVKSEGNETDPWAFLTILNMHTHRDKKVIQDLRDYLLSKASQSPPLSPLPKLLDASSSAQVGLILTERLINVPSQIVPPMYTMLLEEIQWALAENEPYNFSHYLILSKTYTEVASKLDAEDSRPQKKKKAKADTTTLYFHPEDEVLQKHALGFASYDYSSQGDEGAADAKRAFQDAGIKPQGHIILIEASKFEPAVKAVVEYIGVAS
ncbi:Mss4p nuclear export [Elasticomyces elasticus]|nr:Mss4p nuclear export [Elasticomyces elasticus]